MTEQQIPKGYKLTEVGVIPEDWDVVFFGSIRDPKDRYSITGGPFGSNLKSTDYTDKGVRIIQLQNIGDGRFINDYEVYTSEKKANELISCNIYPNEIILSKMGDPVARACIIPDWSSRYLMCSDGIRLKVDMSKYNTFFIFSYLNSPVFRKQAIEASTGSTRQRIGLAELKKLLVVSPLKKEQTAIANALSDTDALISQLTKLITKKQGIKTATMQQLLTGKTRLPGFAYRADGSLKGTKISELGEIPEDWEVKPITQLTDLITCGIASTPDYVVESQGVPFLSSTNIKNGRIVWSNYKYIPINLHKKLYKNNPPKLGDILYSRVGTIGEAAVIDTSKQFSIYVSLTLMKLQKKMLSPTFLMYLLNSEPFKNKAKDQVYLGGGVGNLNINVIRDYLLCTPLVEEQTAIANILSEMDQEITLLETRLAKTGHIKQGMMQQLLTGKIRLI